MKVALPGPRAPVTDENAFFTPAWRQAIEFLWLRTGGNDDFIDSNFNGIEATLAEMRARLDDVSRAPDDLRESEIQQLRENVDDLRRLVTDISVSQSEFLMSLIVSAFMIPFLTSGSSNAARGYLGIADLASQASSNVTITGGTIDNTAIGNTTATAIKGTVINATSQFQFNGAAVVQARETGFQPMTGTPDKGSAYDTATITLAELAGRVDAIQTALTNHGLIGA